MSKIPVGKTVKREKEAKNHEKKFVQNNHQSKLAAGKSQPDQNSVIYIVARPHHEEDWEEDANDVVDADIENENQYFVIRKGAKLGIYEDEDVFKSLVQDREEVEWRSFNTKEESVCYLQKRVYDVHCDRKLVWPILPKSTVSKDLVGHDAIVIFAHGFFSLEKRCMSWGFRVVGKRTDSKSARTLFQRIGQLGRTRSKWSSLGKCRASKDSASVGAIGEVLRFLLYPPQDLESVIEGKEVQIISDSMLAVKIANEHEDRFFDGLYGYVVHMRSKLRNNGMCVRISCCGKNALIPEMDACKTMASFAASKGITRADRFYNEKGKPL